MLAQPQNGYALVMPSRGPYIGQLTQAAEQGSSATLKMTAGSKGSESPGPATITAYDRFAPISVDTMCLFDWVQNGYEIIAAMC